MNLRILCLFFLFVLTTGASSESLPTDDYVYTTGLQWDDEEGMYCFDVMLQGENLYTAYGMDILIPQGWQVSATSKGKPNVVMVDDYCTDIENVIYPYEEGRRGYTYSHEVTPNFPNNENHCHIRVACLSTTLEYLTSTSGPLFRVYVEKNIEDGQWPIGSVSFLDVELNKVGQPYDCTDREDIVVLNSGDCTLPLNVSASAQWSTCVLPFATEIPAGVEAYTVSNSDAEYLYLTEAESITAYTPYILKAEGGFSGNVSGTVDPAGYPEIGVVSANGLNGAITLQDVTEGYVLQNGTEGVKFYPIANGDHFSLKPGKCWLSPDESGSKGMGFSFVDPSGVENVVAETADGALYTLDGKKVVTPVAGQIYVKNGKKVLKK